MDHPELTPEQQRQVAKSKRILWLGLAGIFVIGLAVALILIF